MKRMLAAVLALLLLVTPAFAAGESGRALTREEAVEALYEAAGKPETAGTQRFADVAEEEAAIAWAAEQGIVQGVGGGRFAPDAAVTRQAFAGMLYRYAGSPAVSGTELAEYPDGDRAAGWAKDALLWCVKTGVLPAGSEEGLNPTGTVTETEARAALERLADLPDISVLKQDLETLTAVHRPIGSDGERKAAQYLQRRFREMGYQVTTQTYTDDAGRKGTNVIAARSASGPDADILVFSAHHDSVPTAYGANDNASGVVALLAVAEALKDVPTDTELRFISFTDEENGKNGSRYYTASLTEKERSRMIGDIQLDMLGGLGSGGMSVCTMDGEANWLSDLLREKSGARLEAETASDHASFLERIEIRPEETGYTAEQVRSMIRAMYGKPSSSRTDRDGALVEGWADEIYSKYISYKGTEPCVVTVSGYSVGISNVLASYPVTGGQAAVTDPADAKVWDYLCAILPQETRGKIGEFNLFTDGTSNILAYTSPMKHGDGTVDNTRFSINIDYYDVYDENGAPRDWSKLTYTILHEYGHVLLEDETQVDLSVGQSTHDPAGFIPGSFRRAFYDRFWKDLGASGVGDYEKHPTDYVSRYGANYFHEDIADTFAVFVLGGESRGNTVAEEKLRFFWADAEMVALRISIRQSMGLD